MSAPARSATENDLVIGRQAIFDRDGRIAAYELLFRGSHDHGYARIANHDEATHQVILNTFHDSALDDIVEGLPAFLNVSAGFLTGTYPLDHLLDAGHVVLEILESVSIDAHVIAGARALARKGFRLALDDFVYDASYAPLLDVVDIIKIDVKALPAASVAAHVEMLREHDLLLVAEKIESRSVHARCRDIGFHLFQGFHLARPETITRWRPS
ncbi:MAG: EAL domain-containing protein [Gammaproteobacteria bacterium]|nr:EAL domain-containing protein [Gammaproteobacteria bacterium]